MGAKRQLTGQQFHRLCVISESAPKNGKTQWECRCVCGSVVVVSTAHLARKKDPVKSCGCLRRENTSALRKTHGCSHMAEYSAWLNLHSRCFDTKNKSYFRYGGRGITVAQEWASFDNFLADMGLKPTPEHSIERKDNNEGYSKDNCIWAIRKTQQRNMRSNRLITYQGVQYTLAALAEFLELPTPTVRYRLNAGWSEQYISSKSKRGSTRKGLL